jgi:hypothetical protein
LTQKNQTIVPGHSIAHFVVIFISLQQKVDNPALKSCDEVFLAKIVSFSKEKNTNPYLVDQNDWDAASSRKVR